MGRCRWRQTDYFVESLAVILRMIVIQKQQKAAMVKQNKEPF
jgi:hypothetical protein